MITLRNFLDEVCEREEHRVDKHYVRTLYEPKEELNLAIAVELPDGRIADLDVAPEKSVNPRTGVPSLVFKLAP